MVDVLDSFQIALSLPDNSGERYYLGQSESSNRMRGEKGLALTLPHKLRVFCAVVREVDRRLVVCAVLGPQSGRLGGFEGREGSSSSGLVVAE